MRLIDDPHLIHKLADPSFWLKLQPALHIEGKGEATQEDVPNPSLAEDSLVNPSQDELAQLTQDLRKDGYFQLESVLPFWDMITLSTGIEQIWKEGLPPLFVFLYDECWCCFERLHLVLQATLGPDYQQTANFWSWYVETSDQGLGWGAHRDREDLLLLDGSPQRVTMWISLTDSTPLNSCMYILPAYLDPIIADHQGKVIPNWIKIPNTQDIRALPVPAGSVLCWSDVVAHWGSRSSDQAPFPRLSIACEFQRGDIDQFDNEYTIPFPVLSRKRPNFSDRLRLISKQLVHYGHRYPIPAPLKEQILLWNSEALVAP